MNRKKIIHVILKNSELFNKQELRAYSNEQLCDTITTLFLNIRIKQLKNEGVSCL